jgi:hypothetical protein
MIFNIFYVLFCIFLAIILPKYDRYIVYSGSLAIITITFLPFYKDIYNFIKFKMKGNK